MEVGQHGLLRERFLNCFCDAEIDDLRHRFTVLDRDEDIRWLQVTVDHAFLVSVLNGVAKLNEKSKAILKRELIRVAILRNPNSANQLHYEIRAASQGCPAVQHARNAGMIHQCERLTFRFEPGHDALGVHAQLDHLERDMAPDGFALLSPINDAEAPLADFLQESVSADRVANLLLVERELACGFQGFPENARQCPVREECPPHCSRAVLNGFPQLRVASGRALKKSRAGLL